MVFEDYGWAEAYATGDDRISGEISHALLDRKDGGQMLYFLNACALYWNWNDSLASFQNLERVTRQIVPRNMHTQLEVKSWIEHHLPIL